MSAPAPTSAEDQELERVQARLAATLALAVPLWVERFVDRGWTLDQVVAEAHACGEVIAAQGNALMFPTKHREWPSGLRGPQYSTGEVFNRLASGLAACAFVPGGVSVFGLHFEADPARLGSGKP